MDAACTKDLQFVNHRACVLACLLLSASEDRLLLGKAVTLCSGGAFYSEVRLILEFVPDAAWPGVQNMLRGGNSGFDEKLNLIGIKAWLREVMSVS